MVLLSIQNANANVSLKDIFEGLSSHVAICGKCGFSSSRVLQTLRKVRINRAKLAGVATSAFRLQAGIGFIRFRNCIKKRYFYSLHARLLDVSRPKRRGTAGRLPGQDSQASDRCSTMLTIGQSLSCVAAQILLQTQDAATDGLHRVW